VGAANGPTPRPARPRARRVASLYDRRKAEAVSSTFSTCCSGRGRPPRPRGVREWFRAGSLPRHRRVSGHDPLQVEVARLLAGDRPGRSSWWATPSSRSTLPAGRGAPLPRAHARRPEGGVLHLVQNFRSRPPSSASSTGSSPTSSRLDEADQPATRRSRLLPASPRSRRSWPCGSPRLERERRGAARRGGFGPRRLPRRRLARRGDGSRPGERHRAPSRAGDVLVLAPGSPASRPSRRRSRRRPALHRGRGKSFFDRQEVHETLAVLRAIDDPPTGSPSWPRSGPPSSASATATWWPTRSRGGRCGRGDR